MEPRSRRELDELSAGIQVNMQKLVTCLLLISLHAVCRGQDSLTRPAPVTILDAKAAKPLLSQCSRASLKDVKGFWTPSDSDMKKMASSYPRLLSMRAKACCWKGGKLKTLHPFALQCMGVVIRGKRCIYVNAFPLDSLEPTEDWKTEPIRICDGGADYWGVLFHVDTQQFSDLAFNGE